MVEIGFRKMEIYVSSNSQRGYARGVHFNDFEDERIVNVSAGGCVALP
jgi:hypothetical protein